MRILLVEDEVLIRFSTADMLAALGHSAIEAGTARDALAIIEEQPVDLLLTDVGLPDISGVEMAVQARRMRPQLRVVFATGNDVISGMSGAQELAGAILLRKPYDLKGLAAALFESAPPTP